MTDRSPRPGRCPVCKHPWDDHAEDGCQAQVHLLGSPGTYDCDCMEGGA